MKAGALQATYVMCGGERGIISGSVFALHPCLCFGGIKGMLHYMLGSLFHYGEQFIHLLKTWQAVWQSDSTA
jgi:hypothetical protein